MSDVMGLLVFSVAVGATVFVFESRVIHIVCALCQWLTFLLPVFNLPLCCAQCARGALHLHCSSCGYDTQCISSENQIPQSRKLPLIFPRALWRANTITHIVWKCLLFLRATSVISPLSYVSQEPTHLSTSPSLTFQLPDLAVGKFECQIVSDQWVFHCFLGGVLIYVSHKQGGWRSLSGVFYWGGHLFVSRKVSLPAIPQSSLADTCFLSHQLWLYRPGSERQWTISMDSTSSDLHTHREKNF